MVADIRGYFGQVWQTSEGWKANCPACGDNERKFAWNDKKGVGCCFHSSCRWFYQRGGVTQGRIRAWFERSGFQHVVPEILEEAEETDVSLPEEFELLSELDNDMGETIYAYLGSRGLPKRIVNRAKVGYCKDGKFWGYIIFPIFDEEGSVAYWQGRRFKEREPKFWNPKSSKKSDLVYCVSKCSRPRTIVVVESVINALTLENIETSKQMIVSILGKSMSEAQRDHILLYEKYLREIVIALDGDARRDAVETAEKFFGIVPAIKIANIPDGEDINSLGRQESWSRIRSAEIYLPSKRMKFMVGA